MPINSSGTSRAASQNAARRHLAMAACAACEHSPPLLSVMPRQPERFLKLCRETDRSAGGSAELTSSVARLRCFPNGGDYARNDTPRYLDFAPHRRAPDLAP